MTKPVNPATLNMPLRSERPVRLYDLRDRHCRWVEPEPDADGTTLFCGERKERGSYCECHARLVYDGLPRR